MAGLCLAIAIAVFSIVRIWFGGQTGASQAVAAIFIALLGSRARAGAGPRQGNSRQTLCGRPSTDARRKTGNAPDAQSGMR